MTITNPNVFDTIGATVTRNPNGSDTVSFMVDGYLKSRTYYGYDMTGVYRAAVREFVSPYAVEMIDHYYDALIWSQNGDTLPYIEPTDWEGDVVEFFINNAELLTTTEPWANDPGQAGHDFALTRNGHGAGFWDHGAVEAGNVLTDSALGFGEHHLEITDYDDDREQ